MSARGGSRGFPLAAKGVRAVSAKRVRALLRARSGLRGVHARVPLYSCETETRVEARRDDVRESVAPQGSFPTLCAVAPQEERPPDRPRSPVLHNPSPGRPQVVPMVVPRDSTGRPHAVHIPRTSHERAIPITHRGRRTWAQTARNLGTTMGTTCPICGRIERGENSSTGARSCPRVHHPGCTHGCTGHELRKRHISTQSTTPITTAVLKSFEEEIKEKTGIGRIWGQLGARASLSTSRW